MSRIVAGPFNRVEGDLEITLETGEDKVQRAEVNSPLYRGFERILLGHKPMLWASRLACQPICPKHGLLPWRNCLKRPRLNG